MTQVEEGFFSRLVSGGYSEVKCTYVMSHEVCTFVRNTINCKQVCPFVAKKCGQHCDDSGC